MAKLVYDGPDGTTEEEVAADEISDSGKVRGVRIRREDGSYRHIPDTRLYWIHESEDEGKVGASEP